eukprot:GFUD01067651.1.p1 GENE.GFUD01067651.1~~GFUD01067651.1.p1  ORF type:complete len:222 (-),score=39.63 GFUD01067651.1:346-1011(-)
MVGDWSFSSRTFKLSTSLLFLSSILVAISFFTPYWLQSFSTPKLPNPKFTNLGLWHACFNGFHDKGHQYEVKFYGCRHVLLEEYDIIRSELIKPFFVATQFFFTICFVGMLIAIGLVLMYLLCIDDYYRVKVLRWIGFDLIVAGACGTIALIIFGAQGDGRDFMPDWEQNYLSWSFGLAFVGVVFMYVVAVLFIVEARIMQRKEIARESQEKQQYPMERTV